LNLENIFNIGSLLGNCKIWTTSTSSIDSPFYQTMPFPLNMLKNKLENLEIQEGTIKEIEKIIKICNEAVDIIKQRENNEEGKSKKEIEKLKKTSKPIN